MQYTSDILNNKTLINFVPLSGISIISVLSNTPKPQKKGQAEFGCATQAQTVIARIPPARREGDVAILSLKSNIKLDCALKVIFIEALLNKMFRFYLQVRTKF